MWVAVMSKREEVGEMTSNIFVFFLERQRYLKKFTLVATITQSHEACSENPNNVIF